MDTRSEVPRVTSYISHRSREGGRSPADASGSEPWLTSWSPGEHDYLWRCRGSADSQHKSFVLCLAWAFLGQQEHYWKGRGPETRPRHNYLSKGCLSFSSQFKKLLILPLLLIFFSLPWQADLDRQDPTSKCAVPPTGFWVSLGLCFIWCQKEGMSLPECLQGILRNR